MKNESKSLERLQSVHLITQMIFNPGHSLTSEACRSCGTLVFSPIICNKCKSVLCQNCISGKAKFLKNCPFCLQSPSPNKNFRVELIKNPKIFKKCIFAKNGCRYTSNSELLHIHQETCRFQPYKCPNSGCDSPNLFKKDQFKHKSECPYEKRACESCKKLIVEINLPTHYEECKFKNRKPSLRPMKVERKLFFSKIKSFKYIKVKICQKCNEECTLYNIKECSRCNLEVCDKCTKTCLNCKAIYCINCYKNCPHFEEKLKMQMIQNQKMHKLTTQNSRKVSQKILALLGKIFRFIKNRNHISTCILKRFL